MPTSWLAPPYTSALITAASVRLKPLSTAIAPNRMPKGADDKATTTPFLMPSVICSFLFMSTVRQAIRFQQARREPTFQAVLRLEVAGLAGK